MTVGVTSPRAQTERLEALGHPATVSRLAVALGCTSAIALACTHVAPDPVPLVRKGSYRMGTLLEITLPSRAAVPAREAIDEAFGAVSELEALVSRYDGESELSRLVAEAGAPPRAVDARLEALLVFAVDAHRQTQGAFDVSAAPLIRAWKEAPESARTRLEAPLSAEIAEAFARVGIARIELSERGVALRAATDVDLGGVAKGWALDLLAPRLAEASVHLGGAGAFLASFGESSVLASGAPPGESAWRLLLRSPTGGLAGEVRLRDRAVSVSSSLRATPDGRRAHIVDPRTGSLVHAQLEAAVVAPSCAEAEIWSTALLVLGPERGLALVEAEPGIEAMILGGDGTRSATPGWQAATGFVEYE